MNYYYDLPLELQKIIEDFLIIKPNEIIYDKYVLKTKDDVELVKFAINNSCFVAKSNIDWVLRLGQYKYSVDKYNYNSYDNAIYQICIIIYNDTILYHKYKNCVELPKYIIKIKKEKMRQDAIREQEQKRLAEKEKERREKIRQERIREQERIRNEEIRRQERQDEMRRQDVLNNNHLYSFKEGEYKYINNISHIGSFHIRVLKRTKKMLHLHIIYYIGYLYCLDDIKIKRKIFIDDYGAEYLNTIYFYRNTLQNQSSRCDSLIIEAKHLNSNEVIIS